MENDKRSIDHRKNIHLESIFPEMENLLGKTEENLLAEFSHPDRPVVFIVGCARSGSTLLYQFLANTQLFGYPSNLISRFYYAPYLGVRVQQMLLDFDLKGEIFGNYKPTQSSFRSELGKTRGPREPHEFWYFWNRFFKFEKTQVLSGKELQQVNWKLFFKELHAMQSAFQLPLLMKAMNMNYHLTELAQQSNQIHFLYVKRDITNNAMSLLMARKKFFGTYDQWYSFKPANYNELIKKPVWEQVVDQVVQTNDSIEKQLTKMEHARYTIVNYQAFCKSTSEFVHNLSATLDLPIKDSEFAQSFPCTTLSTEDKDLVEKVTNYYKDRYQ